MRFTASVPSSAGQLPTRHRTNNHNPHRENRCTMWRNYLYTMQAPADGHVIGYDRVSILQRGFPTYFEHTFTEAVTNRSYYAR